MRATRYEHGTILATPANTAKGFLETSVLHYKSAYADKSHGKDETMTASEAVITSLFLGLPSCGIGWIVLAVLRAIANAANWHIISFLFLTCQWGVNIVSILLVLGIINLTTQAITRRVKRY
jgi:hypothetical protein